MANFGGFTKMMSNIPMGRISALARQASSYLAPELGRMAIGAAVGGAAAYGTDHSVLAGMGIGALAGGAYGKLGGSFYGAAKSGFTTPSAGMGSAFSNMKSGAMSGFRAAKAEASRGWGNAGVDMLRSRSTELFPDIAPKAARGADWMFRPRPMY